MSDIGAPRPEDRADHFGDVSVWFSWGAATFDPHSPGAPAQITSPSWFLRIGPDPAHEIIALELSEGSFRELLGELVGPETVAAIVEHFAPKVESTNLGPVLSPGNRN